MLDKAKLTSPIFNVWLDCLLHDVRKRVGISHQLILGLRAIYIRKENIILPIIALYKSFLRVINGLPLAKSLV